MLYVGHRKDRPTVVVVLLIARFCEKFSFLCHSHSLCTNPQTRHWVDLELIADPQQGVKPIIFQLNGFQLNAIQIYIKRCGFVTPQVFQIDRQSAACNKAFLTLPDVDLWMRDSHFFLNHLHSKCSISKCIEDNSYLRINTKSISLHRTRKKTWELSLSSSQIAKKNMLLPLFLNNSPGKTHQFEPPRLKTFLAYGLHDKADGRKARCGHCLTSMGFGGWVLFPGYDVTSKELIVEEIWVFPKIGGKNPKWMVYFMENPIKMDDFGGPPLVLETPKSVSTWAFKQSFFEENMFSKQCWSRWSN